MHAVLYSQVLNSLNANTTYYIDENNNNMNVIYMIKKKTHII